MPRTNIFSIFCMAMGLVFCLLFICEPDPSQAQAQSGAEEFTGTSACRECHEKFYQLWAPSHHGLAMQPYTDLFAQEALTAQAEHIAIGDSRYRAEVGAGQGWVIEDSPSGEKKLTIEQVMGGKNVYYFLTPLDRGRLQTLPLAYDVHKKAWFDTAASGIRHFPGVHEEDEAVHWTESVYTFNTACYRCHVSQLALNYDLKTNAYNTTWEEPGINCETCHGPGDEHVRVCREAGDQVPEDLKLVRGGSSFTAQQNNDACSTCHARMMPITDSFFPGDDFFDHYDLTTLEHDDFHPDGRDLGENYTFTTWRLNPCAKAGQLDCIHCHTSSGRFRQIDDPNSACLPCHEKRVENVVRHSRHEADSEGSLCITCHMPMTRFAHMNRSDHSMLPPTPAATLAFESPNACNFCHEDQDAAWSDKYVREWRERDYQAPVLHRAGLIHDARKQDWTRLDEMLAYLQQEDREEVFANSLVRLLRACDDPRVGPAFLKAMEDPSPLVRSSAAESLRSFPSPEGVMALIKATGDPRRLVRVRAADGLAPYLEWIAQGAPLEEGDLERMNQATKELIRSYAARPDQWQSYYNLGNYYLDSGDPASAMTIYRIALELEPMAVIAMVNLSMAYARLDETRQAEQLLLDALEIEPDSGAVHYNLGLLKAELGDVAAGEEHLRAALASDATLHEAAFNLSILIAKDKPAESIDWSRKAYQQFPSPRYGYTLAYFLHQQGELEDAVWTLEDVIRRRSDYLDAYLMLADIHEKKGRIEEAKAVYRMGMEEESIPEKDRMSLKMRLDRLHAMDKNRGD